MKRIHLTLFFTLAAFAMPLGVRAANEPAQPPPAPVAEQGKLDRHDRAFLKQAAEVNLKEIELGKLAEQRATNPNLKKIGAMLVKDHEQAAQSLSRLAASKGVALPGELSTWNRRSIDKLQKEQGEAFDKEFLSLSSKGHERTVALFEKESARTQDPDIKAWAQKMIPSLKEHLAVSQSVKPEAVAEKPQKKQHR